MTMKSNVWKRTSIVLILAMILIATACTSNNGNGNIAANNTSKDGGTSTPSTDTTTPKEDDKKLSGSLISKELKTLTLHMHVGNRWAFDDDLPVFREAQRMTNIELKGTASKSATDSAEVFNIMMASGDMPDIVHYEKKAVYDKFGMEGAFTPLNDLIDQYAPNIKAFLEKRPDARKYMTAPDGNIYFVNFIPDGNTSLVWLIRQDWLDKLKLEQPKTVDDFYNVLVAFKTQDPNENGKTDEVPLFTRHKINGVRDYLVLWNARRHTYLDNDKIKFGPLEDNYETAVQNIRKWYSEGLFDQEAFTRGTASREFFLASDTGGASHDWLGSSAGYNDTLKDKVPGINYVTMAPPAGPDGVHREEAKCASVSEFGWGISSTSKNKELAIKYFDFWFSEEGARLMNYGIEGEHYDMVDGKPKFQDWILHDPDKGTLDLLDADGAQVEIGFPQNFDYEKQWMNKTALDGVELYTKGDYFVEQLPTLSYTAEEKKERDNLDTTLDTYIKEQFQKWVLGAEEMNDSTFAAFKDRLKSMGVERLIEIEQAAYDRYLKM